MKIGGGCKFPEAESNLQYLSLGWPLRLKFVCPPQNSAPVPSCWSAGNSAPLCPEYLLLHRPHLGWWMDELIPWCHWSYYLWVRLQNSKDSFKVGNITSESIVKRGIVLKPLSGSSVLSCFFCCCFLNQNATRDKGYVNWLHRHVHVIPGARLVTAPLWNPE